MHPATALVTGATGGLGEAIAARLAASGTQVLAHGNKVADFSSLAEVRRFGEHILKSHARLDLLINNAGIGFGPPGAPREKSRDGHELRLAVNYLAPANAIHPATLMPTRMVAESGLAPASTIDEGAEAVLHLAASPALAATSGEFFDGHRAVRALPMAYDARARQRLRSLTLQLTGLG